MKELLLGICIILAISLAVMYQLDRVSRVPIERKWLDEETVCFYQGRVLVNCQIIGNWE